MRAAINKHKPAQVEWIDLEQQMPVENHNHYATMPLILNETAANFVSLNN